MKALSLRQPWAWMVAHGAVRLDGIRERKTIENGYRAIDALAKVKAMRSAT